MMTMGHSSLDFEELLQKECFKILEDETFRRAPVQSQLLRYLLRRTLQGGKPPSQYEIAVEGLGRTPDIDSYDDSYPRVQVSRLRAHLDRYYANNQPLRDMRLVLLKGAYSLSLEHYQSLDPLAAIATGTARDDLINSILPETEPSDTPKSNEWHKQLSPIVFIAGLVAAFSAALAAVVTSVLIAMMASE